MLVKIPATKIGLELSVCRMYRDINKIQISHFDLCHQVMARSVFLAIKYGGRAMAVTSEEKPASAGSIVVTSSVAGSNAGFGDIAYCEPSQTQH